MLPVTALHPRSTRLRHLAPADGGKESDDEPHNSGDEEDESKLLDRVIENDIPEHLLLRFYVPAEAVPASDGRWIGGRKDK